MGSSVTSACAIMLLLVCGACPIFSQLSVSLDSVVALQVVSNPMLMRGASMHDGAVAALKGLTSLDLHYARFAFWFPYPLLGVAELYPPATAQQCTVIPSGQIGFIQCPAGALITSVNFASYGRATGQCGSFTADPKCDSPGAQAVLSALCLNQAQCTINVTDSLFGGSPCAQDAWLALQVTCGPVAQCQTSWDFSQLDPMVEDLMVAAQGRPIIMELCTSPQWLWVTPSPVEVPASPIPVDWGYSGGNVLRDPTGAELGAYFARVASWYTRGGFVDECGTYHHSGHNYTFDYWEVFNEPEAEHSMSAQDYTVRYDAIVDAMAPVVPSTRFVALALAYATDANWLSYFLNSSNHRSQDAFNRLAFISYHHYDGGDPNNPDSFEGFFSGADSFVSVAAANEEIRRTLAPQVRTTANEMGTILWGDPGIMSPLPDIYWVASGADFAYTFARIGPVGVAVSGMSQLIGYPTQYPSVSMIEFRGMDAGAPNARYWVLWLLVHYFNVNTTPYRLISSSGAGTGDVLVNTYIIQERQIMLCVNKKNAPRNVTVPGGTGATYQFVDVTTGYGLPKERILVSEIMTLQAFSTAIVVMPGQQADLIVSAAE